MSYLLDTNVISELLRPNPNIRVLAWFKMVPNEALHLSVLTLGEIRKGIERLQEGGTRKEQLRLWLEQDLPNWFGDRFLTVSHGVADRWGVMLAQGERRHGAIDSLIAATALHHGLRMVTRNEADFRFEGLEVVNPWRAI